MDSLMKALPAILKAAGAAKEVAEAACIAAWRHAVGAGLSEHAAAVQLLGPAPGQTLVVVVADNIWKRQLEQMRAQLLFKLNSVLGQPLVKLIELRVDPKTLEQARQAETKPGQLAETKAGQSAETKAGKPMETADYRVPEELLSAAAGIEDAQLRRAFLGAAVSCVKRLENPQSEIRNPKF